MRTLKLAFILFVTLLGAVKGYSQGQDQAFATTGEHGDGVKSIQIYPNPVVENLTIKFEHPIAKKVKITVNNIIGGILEAETEAIDEHELQVKVKDLPSGYYLISISDPLTGFKNTYKFIKR